MIKKRHEDSLYWYSMEQSDNDAKHFISSLEGIWALIDGEQCDESLGNDISLRLSALVGRTRNWTGKRIHIVMDQIQVITSHIVLQALLCLLHQTEDQISYIFLTNGGIPEILFPHLVRGRENSYSSRGNVFLAHTFGRFRVTASQDGKELAWRTRKGKELFAYLLDVQGKEVDRRQLMEVLWQDEIPENAVAMLHNMIYHIRKEFSAYCLESILTYENRKYSLSMEGMLCDYCHIEKIAEMVEGGRGADLRRERKYFLTYWGSYLEDIDGVWAEGRRRYFDAIYIRGSWMLAEQYTREKEYGKAVQLYENILVLEPYSEQAVEKLLSLYGKMRAWERMRRCFREFSETLYRDLGIVPGKEVLSAYHAYIKE